MKHTASASVSVPGWVTIKRGSTTEIGFWAWHLKSCHRPEHRSGCRLIFKDGMWLESSASVDDVLIAVGAAMKIYTAIKRQDTADREISLVDALDQVTTQGDAVMPTPSDFKPFSRS